jgi:hypothetical protein
VTLLLGAANRDPEVFPDRLARLEGLVGLPR